MKSFVQFSLGAFLLLAGISLFIFSVQPAYGEQEDRPIIIGDTATHLKVVYVNIDSINAKYTPFVELSKSAGEGLQQKMESYQKSAADLELRYATLQERVNLGTISTSAAEREEAAINAGLDDLKKQETELAYLEQRAMERNDSISQEIALYFHDYSVKHEVDYVFMYGTGMPIIYANKALDITNIALSEMNAPFQGKVKDAGKGKKK